jgi:hypothetical protein
MVAIREIVLIRKRKNKMTLSTDKKNIEKIVKAILQNNGIDNLKAEIDISSAWHRYLTEREEGLTPAETRLKITAEFNPLGFSERGRKKRNQIKQEFMDVMMIEFGGEDSTDWSSLLDHLVKASEKGETIRTYAEWCKADPYNSPKTHQIAQKPLLVKMTWNAAFIKQDKQTESEYPTL